jgi:hypothetical protein
MSSNSCISVRNKRGRRNLMTIPTTSSTETREWDRHLTSRAERTASGKALRSKVPRSSHAIWVPNAKRPDPISLLEKANTTRLKHLVPIRLGRMAKSPFAFYRGSADIMAHDLSKTPISGISTQICGDAYLSNFACMPPPSAGRSSTSTTSTRPSPVNHFILWAKFA